MSELPRRALVLGLARSGQAAARAMARRGIEVYAVDGSTEVEIEGLRELGVEVALGDDEGSLHGAKVLVKSPGVPSDAHLVQAAHRMGVPVWSEIELASRMLPNPIVGVTGTNGKTTTTELLGAIFRAAGRPVEVAGNVGRALSELDGVVDAETWIVCELSSFQLEDIVRFTPRVAVLLNVEPDHLDRHGDFESYRAAKLRIFENQTAADYAIVPRGFGEIPGAALRIEFDATDELPGPLALPGAHNRENAAAATAAARAAGIADEAIARALATFPGVPHRLEDVGEVGGVRYVNDSKATNTAAARRAVESFEDGERLHVIVGGRGKGESYDELAALLRERADGVYTIGETAAEIGAALTAAGAPCEHARTLERAVERAAASARPGDVVLLAPACASFDQFTSFEARGDAFRELVSGLAQ